MSSPRAMLYTHKSEVVSKKSKISKNKGGGKTRLTLKWGGRPYKNKNKSINIPENTKLVNGILVAREKTYAVSLSPNPKSKNLVVVDEGVNFTARKTSNTRHHIEGECDKQDYSVYKDIEGTITIAEQPEQAESEIFEDVVGNVIDDNNMIDDTLSCQPYLTNNLAHSVKYNNENLVTDLFSFYVRETSQLFIVSNSEQMFNPFETTLPSMAMENQTLLKLLAVLAGQHRSKMGYEGRSAIPNSSLASINLQSYTPEVIQNLFNESLLELQHKLLDPRERFSNMTLACILILASIDIFFDQKNSRWRTHLYGAKGIILEKLRKCNGKVKKTIFYSLEEDIESFLTRWFMYLNVISLLSSPEPTLQEEIYQQMDFVFCPPPEKRLSEMEGLRDIQYTSGMEPTVLSFLAKVSQMIFEKEKVKNAEDMEKLMASAVESDYDLSTYLVATEKERDFLFKQRSRNNTTRMTSVEQGYQLLRSTNLIFGLTGLLLLRRRVLNLSSHAMLVNQLLIRVSSLLKDKIPLNSPAQSCLLICIFCCGCELVDDSVLHLRTVYMDHLRSLCKSGMSGAVMAQSVMQECWNTKKSWWQVLKEKKQHISFAI